MTIEELTRENEQLRIQIQKLKAELETALAYARRIQERTSLANCAATGMVNALQGTTPKNG